MGNLDFFAELSATNRAHCAAHGFSSAELYGTAPNESELETSRLIAAGVPSESAGMFAPARMEAERLRMRKIVVSQQRDIRLRNRGYAEGRFKRLVNIENYLARQRGAA